MLIDWFTVIAEIVNFLVLVLLMRRFLFGPLVAAIDAREKTIADRLSAAAAKECEAAEQAARLESETAAIEQQKASLLNAAKEDADRERGEMLSRARLNIVTLEKRWHSELEIEKAAFLSEVRRRAAAELVSITRDALHDLASVDLQECAVRSLVEQIGSLDAAGFRALAAAGVTVVTHDDLLPEQKDALRNAVEQRLEAPVPIAFEHSRAMTWGIDLRGSGQRIGWTPDAYLDTLEARLRNELEKAAAETCPVAV